MKTVVLASLTAPWMPVVAFLLFVLAFVLLCWPVIRKSLAGHWQRMAHLPLNDEGVCEDLGNTIQGDKK